MRTDHYDSESSAHALARDLDEAMRHGSLHGAQMIAASILRLGCTAPTVLERVARMHYTLGDMQRALDVIDGAAEQTAALTVLRACCLLRAGQMREALATLEQCGRTATAPIAARLLHALLLMEDAADAAEGIALLRSNIALAEDHASHAALICGLIARKRPGEARAELTRLLECGHLGMQWPSPLLFARSFGIPESCIDTRPASADVEILANELICNESIIDALLAAQEIEPNHDTLTLLQRALLRCGSQLRDPAMAIAAHVRITRLLGDDAAARRWLTVGMRQHPMSLALRSLADDLPERQSDMWRIAA